MKRFLLAGTIGALCLSGTVQAAEDAGLTFAQAHGGARQSAGVSAALTLRFGDGRTVRADGRTELSLAMGPMLSRGGNGAPRAQVAGLAGFRLRPGYSATLTLAGQPVATRYTELGAVEARNRARDDGDHGGPSTGGWIGIGLGVLAVGLGVSYLAIEDALDCNENGKYVCE